VQTPSIYIRGIVLNEQNTCLLPSHFCIILVVVAFLFYMKSVVLHFHFLGSPHVCVVGLVGEFQDSIQVLRLTLMVDIFCFCWFFVGFLSFFVLCLIAGFIWYGGLLAECIFAFLSILFR